MCGALYAKALISKPDIPTAEYVIIYIASIIFASVLICFFIRPTATVHDAAFFKCITSLSYRTINHLHIIGLNKFRAKQKNILQIHHFD